MNDAFAMRCHHRVGDRDGNLEQFRKWQRTPAQALLERLSIEKLHHDEVVAVGARHVVNRAYVRVVQGRNGPRFTLEPRAELGIVAEAIRCQLEGDDAVQTGIAGFVHFAHAARTCEFEDLVRPEPVPDARDMMERSAGSLSAPRDPVKSLSRVDGPPPSHSTVALIQRIAADCCSSLHGPAQGGTGEQAGGIERR